MRPGVRRVIDVPFDDDEQQRFADSAATIQRSLDELGIAGASGAEPGTRRDSALRRGLRGLLGARTFCEATPRSTMSATERWLPSSPYGSGGLTPARRARHRSCLPSSATKIFAFCSPNPGSACSRSSSSSPVASRRVQTRRRVAVVLVDERSGTAPARARPSSRGSGGCAGGLREHGCELARGPAPRSRAASRRRRAARASRYGAHERPLHRDLLIEQHADQQGERVVREQPVEASSPVTCSGGHASMRGARRRRRRDALRRQASTYCARCWPVSVERSATRAAGVPSNTTVPPS